MELGRPPMPVSLAVSDSDLDRIRYGSDVPPLLATIPPSIGQRRVAGMFMLALLASVLVTWPFATVQLPAIPAFVPIIAAALFISYGVTAVLLFGQFSILRHRALLVIASGYLFSGLMAVAHSLAFPGAFSPTGLNGAGLQSAILLYDIWHAGLPFAAIGYALLKDVDGTASTASTRLTISSSVAAMVVLTGAIFWFLTRYNDLLPVSYVDLHPLSLFRRIIGGVVETAISATALCVIWVRRRTLFDEWLMVALCAIVTELVLAALLPGERFNVAWYAARLYQAVTATVVMIVLLAETIRLYGISLDNSRLYHDLADREGKIRRLVDANIIGIFIADRESRILEANDAFLRIVGYDREDLVLGRVRWTELSPPEWRERDRLTRAQLHSTGIVQPFEKEYFRKDGSRVPVLVGVALFKEGGDRLAFVLDLTERKRAEDRLRRSEAWLSQAQRLSRSGNWVYSATTKLYIYWSDESYRIWGFDPLQGLPSREDVWRRIHPDDRDRVRETVQEAVRQKTDLTTEFRILLPDGTVKYLEGTSHHLFSSEGALLEAMAATVDVTQRKRTEEALRESERSLRSAIDGIPGLVGVLAPNGEVESVNRQILEYCGRSLEELRDWGTNGTIHPDDLPHLAEVFTKAIAAGVPFGSEARVRRFDGEFRWFEIRGIPVRDASDRIVRWYSLLTDTEDRTQALARLQQMQSDFAHMNRVSTMGEFAASLAHEILHPIATARNNARAGMRFLEMNPPNP